MATGVAVLPALPIVVLGLGQRRNQLSWIRPMTLDTVFTAPGRGVQVRGCRAARNRARAGRALAGQPAGPRDGGRGGAAAGRVDRGLVRDVVAVGAPVRHGGRARTCLLAAATLLSDGPPARSCGDPPPPSSCSPRWRYRRRRICGALATHDGPNSRAAGAVVARDQQPGDVIIYGTGFGQVWAHFAVRAGRRWGMGTC